MQEEVRELKEHLEEKKIRGLALDIDETLAATSQHWFALLFEKLGNPERRSAKEMAEKYTVVENVPYWNALPEFQTWHKQAVSSEALHADVPLVAYAKETVDAMKEEIPFVAYITGRPENLRQVTHAWLQHHGFDELPLIMKPPTCKEKSNNEWKAEILHELYPYVTGIVDDNPGLSTYLADDYAGTVFVLGKKQTEDARENIIACEDWQEVYKTLQHIQG